MVVEAPAAIIRGTDIAGRSEERTGHRIELPVVGEEQTLEALMARDQLRATLRENFYALEENLSRGDAGALCGHDGGCATVCDNEFEGESLHDLDRAGWDPDIAEASAEDPGRGGRAREAPILGILRKY